MIVAYARKVAEIVGGVSTLIVVIEIEALRDFELPLPKGVDALTDTIIASHAALPLRRGGSRAVLFLGITSMQSLIQAIKGFTEVSNKPSCFLAPVWRECCGVSMDVCVDSKTVEDLAHELGFTRTEFLIPMTLEKSFGSCEFFLALCM